jgi:hypothetical protein
MISVFTDKEITPGAPALKKALGSTYKLWQELEQFALVAHPKAHTIWNYSAKYGWSLRINDNKRAILYLLPRDGFFKAALVFGQKATDAVLGSDVADDIKTELKNAKLYAEGRGIRIVVDNEDTAADIKKLVTIKVAH